MTCGVWSYMLLRQGGGIDEECTQSNGMDGIFSYKFYCNIRKAVKQNT
jgi:hypothetical protein